MDEQAFIDGQDYINNIIDQTITAAGNSYRAKSLTDEDFQLPDKQVLLDELVEDVGWVQRYIRIGSQLGSQCIWKPAYKGEPVENGILEAIVSQIKPSNGTQKNLRSKSLTLQSKLGCHAAVITDTNTGVRFNVEHPDTLLMDRSDPESLLIQTHPDDQRPPESGGSTLRVHRELVRKHWKPDDKWSNQPWTELCGAIKDILLYCCLHERAMAMGEQSKIVNQIIHFKPDSAMDGARLNTGDKPYKSHVDAVVEGYMRLARKAYKDNGPARTLPYPAGFSGDIDVKDLGAKVGNEDLDILFRSIELAALGLPIPSNWLMVGEGGSANHWGDAEQRRALHQQRIQPELDTNDDFWSEYAFRPLVNHRLDFNQVTSLMRGTNLDDWSLYSDMACIEVKPDNANQLLELYKCGVVCRSEVAAAAGVEVFELPDDYTEIEFLLMLNGKTGPSSVTELNDPDSRAEMPEITEQALSL